VNGCAGTLLACSHSIKHSCVDAGAHPTQWCPTCGAEKVKFKNMGKKVAGFEQNQTYGLGANSMTSDEKSGLIFGSLAVFFGLFLAGYFLE